MKTINLISMVMVFAMVIVSATSSFGQNEVRIALKGNAYAVGTQDKAGLEVDGKLVVAKQYKSFQTDGNGILFAVEANDGKYGVVDRNGTWIYKPTYYKAQITGDMIRLQATANSEPKFYKVTSPTTEVKVTALDPNTFNPEIKENFRLNSEKAKEIAAQDTFAAFEFRMDEKGRQGLYVDGKNFFEAKKFYLISTYDYYKKSTCWFFIVTDKVSGYGKDAYGLYGLCIYTDKNTGKKGIEAFLTIPIEYSYIGPVSNGEPAVKCTTFSGASKYFTWYGDAITAK
ncbi:MAG: hypothetical protein LBG92_05605 [Prevotellaceae bacterium]|nr:hypothetical protein [Prevotellaceae bacterium]